MSDEERPVGDVPADPSGGEDGERALVSDEVVATYIADAVSSVPGVARMHGSTWERLSEKMHAGSLGKGVCVHERESGAIAVDVHVRVSWGAVIPELAARVEGAVRRKVESMLDIEVDRVTLYVDEVEAPARAGESA